MLVKQTFIQLLPNINHDNKAWLKKKKKFNYRVTIISDIGYKNYLKEIVIHYDTKASFHKHHK